MSLNHDPNPTPPTPDPTFHVVTPADRDPVTVQALRRLPVRELPQSFIVSTGHGTSGPFAFAGVTLRDVIEAVAPGEWAAAEIVSADGFATRVTANEWLAETARPILLAYEIDGRPMSREEGLVRLIVPTETDEALRQVKWISEIRLL
ncbi:MAG: molybdopterin-dependent oxidoreductase [Candidatus Promineofilum sp.]|nr:molybdopterin-dependent oxidoreductase [Promineifilum sp.]MCW5862723.1 molybdopterin-dependent oxidoreductase [Anaerolineae bacterium]